MRTRRRPPPIVTLGLLAVLGSQARGGLPHDPGSGSRGSTANQPANTTAPAKGTPVPATTQPVDEVPAIYIDGGAEAPLTAEQKKEILGAAGPLCPAGQRFWFIRVMQNHTGTGGMYTNASVLFTPHNQGPRLRKGRYAWVEVTPPLTAEENRQMGRRALRGDDNEVLRQWVETLPAIEREVRAVAGDYCQVSLRGRPFGRRLDLPEGTLVSFPAPRGFTDEEIVEIVDFVRTNPAAPLPPVRPGASVHLAVPRLDGTKPIVRIERGEEVDRQILRLWAEQQADEARAAGVAPPNEEVYRRLLATPEAIKGLIKVWTGHMRNPVDGGGESIDFVKTEKGFVVLSTGSWVS